MAKTAKKKAAQPQRAAGRKASTPARAVVANGTYDAQREVEQFLYRQAELLDDKRWGDFIDLFAADGCYWMPASPDQTTADGTPAIFYEDRNLMNVRMKRIMHPHAWSQSPMWGTSHLVSNVTIEAVDPRTGGLAVRSRFHMMEFRRDVVRHFAGVYRHQLDKTSDGFRIKLQRVDVVNGEGPYDYVLLAWV
ncbi:MAG TPA: aromatic-ring-hydroxylating dioxygenase subunit beta [Candidatus Binataceae bacterium]|nr:aromatic-ring-hydroxylating dioxygenase subunit beta [Candidatus Binataceae bacterium]